MSQHDFIISDQGMPAARADLNAGLQALASTSKGPSAPTAPYAGQLWLDDDTPSATLWTLNLYDGTDWIALGQFDATANSFTVTNGVKTNVTPSFAVAINEAAFVDVASLGTTDIGAAASNNVRITGATTITSLGTAAAGITRRVRFAAALTLTHNATALILPGAANITTAADDCAVFTSLGSGNWICVNYQPKASVSGLAAASQAEQEAASATTVATTPGRQHFHPSAAKCWGYVTYSAGTPTLQVNFNVTSITDSGVGDVTVTVATDFSSANYAVNGTAQDNGGGGDSNVYEVTSARAAGAFELRIDTTAGAAQDSNLSFAAFGDHA